jgi:hypothetical protein
MKKKDIKRNLKGQPWQEPNRGRSDKAEEPSRCLPEVIKTAREAFEKKLQGESFKPTLAEYLKLLQFEQEMTQEEEAPREITVTWVEPESDYSEE